MMWDNGNGWRMHDQSGPGWVMVMLMLLVVVAAVVATVAILRGTTMPSAGPGTRAVDPRAILQERFARGEIDEQDYRSRVRALDETG